MSGGWWNRPASNGRIGRIGDWGGSGSSSQYALRSSFITIILYIVSRRPQGSGRRVATLGDVGSSGPPTGGAGGGGPGRGPDDDDDSDDENGPRDEGESWYAGGERRCAFHTASL
jgi:UBX domain-containing protein 1